MHSGLRRSAERRESRKSKVGPPGPRQVSGGKVGNRRKRLLFGVLFGGCSSMAAADVALQSTSFGDGWVEPGEQISFRLDQLPPGGAASVAVFIGNFDATALFYESAPGEFTYLAPQVPLPSGEQELVVYYIAEAQQWQEMGRAPLRVLTRSGFEQVEVAPQIETSLDMQNDSEVSGDAFPPERSTYNDLNLRAGLSTRHQRGDTVISSRFAVVGSSFRGSALRFGTEGDEAPKIDLSDYLVDVQVDRTRAQLGHVSYGNNPLLLSGLANRGVVIEHRFNPRFDASFSSQSGVGIVGYENISGLTEETSRINAATVGVEMMPDTPGRLRTEVSYVTAKVPALSNFGVGQVPVAEESDGYGVRLIATNASRRLRGDFAYARSSYTNPTDRSLEFDGTDIVDVEETTNNAYSGRVEYDILSGYALSEQRFVNLTGFVSHEEVEPQYKTLAAFPNSDRRQTLVGFNGQIGNIGLQVQFGEARDNLDDIPTILTTKTRNQELSLAGPLQSFLGMDEAQSAWWPSFSFAAQRVHQFADNRPPAAESDFDSDSHLPDQVSKASSTALSWSFERWSLGYQFAYSLQDNRQQGRERSDFRNRDHSVNASFRVTDRLTLGARVGRSENDDREFGITREADTYGATVDWLLTDRLSLSGSYDDNRNSDDIGQASSNSDNLSAQLAYRFELPGPNGRKLPAQAFVRYARQASDSSDNVFGFNTSAETWAVNSGISLSFY